MNKTNFWILSFADLYGPSSYVIMDTDYNDYALLCTCQSAGLVITTLHRRSCTILGREPVRNPDVSSPKMIIFQLSLTLLGTILS